MLLSLSFHEFSHAAAAYLMGDDTAKRQGRLTLNPLRHIDPLGTVVVPLLAAFSGARLFGWAKPVPVDPSNFSPRVNRHLAHAFVAAAGPLSNLFLAVLSAFVASQLSFELMLEPALRHLIVSMFSLNLVLCVFNLLPLYPLDGSRLLPAAILRWQQRATYVPTALFLVVVMVPEVSRVVLGYPVAFLSLLIQRGLGLQVPVS